MLCRVGKKTPKQCPWYIDWLSDNSYKSRWGALSVLMKQRGSHGGSHRQAIKQGVPHCLWRGGFWNQSKTRPRPHLPVPSGTGVLCFTAGCRTIQEDRGGGGGGWIRSLLEAALLLHHTERWWAGGLLDVAATACVLAAGPAGHLEQLTEPLSIRATLPCRERCQFSDMPSVLAAVCPAFLCGMQAFQPICSMLTGTVEQQNLF